MEFMLLFCSLLPNKRTMEQTALLNERKSRSNERYEFLLFLCKTLWQLNEQGGNK